MLKENDLMIKSEIRFDLGMYQFNLICLLTSMN